MNEVTMREGKGGLMMDERKRLHREQHTKQGCKNLAVLSHVSAANSPAPVKVLPRLDSRAETFEGHGEATRLPVVVCAERESFTWEQVVVEGAGGRVKGGACRYCED